MLERRYKIGLDRQQTTLMPAKIDDYVSETNIVRAIDAYIESLDMEKLGFKNSNAGSKLGGQPAYPPRAMLKLYLYGYMNRIRSSRRLEREAQVNIEAMWLLQMFKPSHTAIADFRKDNLKALKGVNRDFVKVCREMDLYGGEEAAIDGTFMRGNASKASVFTKERLEKEAEELEKKIERYLSEMEKRDQSEWDMPPAEDAGLSEKLKKLKQRQYECKTRLDKLEQSGETQVSETDADARFLRKRGKSMVGYNAQIAVDAKHKLIIYNDVVNDGNDSQQLAPMALKAKEILEVEHFVVDADTGYENQKQIKECVDAGITPYVALSDKESKNREDGRFVRSEFNFDAETDSYRCPAGKPLVRQGSLNKDGKIFIKYASKPSICEECPLRNKCLPEKTKYRQMYRWEHEEVMDAHRQRMKESGRAHMKTRASLAEHPFGTMKSEMGWRHFLMRGLEKVRAEMDLQVISYNFKRMLNIVGIIAFKNHLDGRIVA